MHPARTPSELLLCRAAIAFCFTNKSTSLKNYISAIANLFVASGPLRRGFMFHRVKRNLMRFFAVIDNVQHKLPARLKHLVLLAKIPSVFRRRFFPAMIVTYWAALRISELMRLVWEDLYFMPTGVRLTVQRAKNHAQPRHCFLPVLPASHAQVCPARHLLRLRDNKKSRAKKIFPFGSAAFRKYVTASMAAISDGHFTPHSFRAGFCTDAHAARLPSGMIDEHCRWASATSHRSYNHPDVQDRVRFGFDLGSSLCS